MTISEAIAKADEQRPNNNISTATKIFWLNETETRVKELADGRILADGESYSADTYDSETDQNTELLVPDGYAGLYPLYLVAMIDYSQSSPAVYANSSYAYENAWGRFAAWFAREHRQKENGQFKYYE
ncbi:MAG: hypothetical protein J5756_07235 [Clostridia bacterium]|nr:hypothetical protein [Clostridia bacterium]